MSSRMFLMRQVLLLAFGIGAVIVGIVAAGLALGGLFTPVWFGRAIFVIALLFGGFEVLLIPRTFRVNTVRGKTAIWRQNDRSQGCTVLFLGALITMGLFACGSLMVWWMELR